LVFCGIHLQIGKFMSNEELLDLLIRAAGNNNEFDNRRELEYYRLEVLQRMKNDIRFRK
jgi:hypothetical protein